MLADCVEVLMSCVISRTISLYGCVWALCVDDVVVVVVVVGAGGRIIDERRSVITRFIWLNCAWG